MLNILTVSTVSKTAIVTCSISRCGSYLAYNSDVQTLQIVSLKSQRLKEPIKEELTINEALLVLFEYKMGSSIRCLDFGYGDVSKNRLPHRSNKRRTTYPVMDNVCLLAVGLRSGQVKIYSLIPGSHYDGIGPLVEKEGNAKLILHNHYEDMATVSFSPDGSLRLASISIDGKLCLWDMWDDGNMYQAISIPNSFRPSCCAWGNKSKQICVAGNMGKCYIYQSEKPCVKLLTLNQVHHNDISSCKYSADDSLLGTSSYDTSIVIWCGGTYKPMIQLWHSGTKPSLIVMGGAHSKYVRDFEFSPDCVNFVSVSDDNFIRIWNLEDTEAPVDQFSVPFSGRKLILSCVKFTPDGTKFLVCTSEGKILFFKIKDWADSLANLCRKSVRRKLVFQLHNLTTSNQFAESEEKQSDVKPISLLEMQASNIRRRSTSDIFTAIESRRSLNFSSVVEELPLPGMLKSYLQYGFNESQLIDDGNPKSLRSNTRNMSIY